MVALLALDRQRAGVADDVSRNDPCETDDRDVVAGQDVPVRGAEPEAVAAFMDGVGGDDDGPRQTEVRLPEIEQRLLADDQLFVVAHLIAALITGGEIVVRGSVPVETSGVI